jgi:dTDP-4-dehydrorhamnose 3,5-epimerase
MQIEELSLSGVKLIIPRVFHDERGFFLESYNEALYSEAGIGVPFVQDNHSLSSKGTLRGMHFQRRPGQAKLVRVVEGVIFDVVVDIRPDSPTFGKWEGVYLDAKMHQQLFVPVGFAHGFCVVSETAQVLYKVSNRYDPAEEKGFRFDDPQVAIVWPLQQVTLSKRDQEAPLFCEIFK